MCSNIILQSEYEARPSSTPFAESFANKVSAFHLLESVPDPCLLNYPQNYNNSEPRLNTKNNCFQYGQSLASYISSHQVHDIESRQSTISQQLYSLEII